MYSFAVRARYMQKSRILFISYAQNLLSWIYRVAQK